LKARFLAALGGILLIGAALAGGGSPLTGPIVPKVAPPIEGGNAVLIVYEAGKLLPAQQAPVINSVKVRDWAVAHQADFRAWDHRTQVTAPAEARFLPALRRERPLLPWLYASINGKGIDAPLPASVDATIAALEEVAK
jgi:hypothetical protein